MKKVYLYILSFLCLGFSMSTKAQCDFHPANRYTIYYFSSVNTYTLKEILGVDINPTYLNFISVTDKKIKQKIDDACLAGKLETSVFIYFDKADKIVRYCNQDEYRQALKNKSVPEFK